MFGNYDYQASLDGIKKQYDQLTQLAMQQPGFAEAMAPPQHVPRVSGGIAGAREYKLGRDSDVAIFDMDEDVFYFRQTDANGNELPIKIGRYTLEDPPKSDSDFVTVKDFEALKADVLCLLREKLGTGNEKEETE